MIKENNTSTPIESSPNLYVSNLVELDRMKDEQELTKAEYNLGNDKNNSYWIGRVKFIKEKIELKIKIEQKLNSFSLK